MTGVSVTRLSVTEPHHLHGALATYGMRCVPLPGPRFHVGLTTISAPGIALQVGECSPLIGHGAPADGIVAIQVPLGGRQTLRLNGQGLEGPAIGLYGPRSEVHRANAHHGTWLVIALAPGAAEALLDPPSGTALLRRNGHALRPIPAAALAAMARFGQAALTAAAEGCLDAPPAAEGFAADLAGAARSLLHSTAREIHVERATAENLRIVARAEGYLAALPARPVYNEELCHAAGTSSTRLGVAFRAVLQTSPQRYLKLQRLTRFRLALRDPGSPHDLVKSIALRHGFWHLGQLAADYQGLFHESPSQTLAAGRRYFREYNDRQVGTNADSAGR